METGKRIIMAFIKYKIKSKTEIPPGAFVGRYIQRENTMVHKLLSYDRYSTCYTRCIGDCKTPQEHMTYTQEDIITLIERGIWNWVNVFS